jgi:hypothetical protein
MHSCSNFRVTSDVTGASHMLSLGVLVRTGACVLVGSITSFPYRYLAPSQKVMDLQLRAMLNYYCDASINYDLLPSIRNRVLFFAGMKVRACK